MMHNRFTKPGFFANERLAALSPEARLLFIGLWQFADREGRFEDRPGRIRAEVFPYHQQLDVKALIDELSAPDEDGVPFVQRYKVGNGNYGWIPKFLNHQHPHKRESASILPPPPGQAQAGPRSSQGGAKVSPGSSPGTAQATPRNGPPNGATSEEVEPRSDPGDAQAQPGPGQGPAKVAVEDPDPDPERRGGQGQSPRYARPTPLDPWLLQSLRNLTGKDEDHDDFARFLKAAQRYPEAQVDAAVRAFLERGPDVHRKPLASYLLKMVREGAGSETANGVPIAPSSHGNGPLPTPRPKSAEEIEEELAARGRALREAQKADRKDPQPSTEGHEDGP